MILPLLLALSAAAAPARVGPDAVWQPRMGASGDFRDECLGKAVEAAGGCLLGFMKKAGAAPAAIGLARRLEGFGWMTRFEAHGPVDVAYVRFPFRANANEGVLLVNGEPPLLDVSDYQRLKPLEDDPRLASVRASKSDAGLWATEPESPKVSKRAGGLRFEFVFPVRVCHACEDLARARVAYDFDARGRFLGARLLGVAAPK